MPSIVLIAFLNPKRAIEAFRSESWSSSIISDSAELKTAGASKLQLLWIIEMLVHKRK